MARTNRWMGAVMGTSGPAPNDEEQHNEAVEEDTPAYARTLDDL